VSALEVIVDVEPRKPFFTVNGLATYLALSVRTVREMLSDGRLPSYKFEGARRIAATDVDAYVAANRDENARKL
jgi:excisionase family DNA binding protein